MLVRLVLLTATLCAAAAGAGPVGAKADTAPTVALDAAIERYRVLLVADVDRSVASVEKLRDSVARGDLAAARQAWIEARVGWERAEVFTSGFAPELDREIDAWPNGPTGFHAIEVTLFGAGRSNVSSEVDALLRDLTEMAAKARQTRLTPQGLLDGLSRLAYEVGESKLDGGESRVSGTSLDDIRHNVEGIELAYGTIFAAAIESRDPDLCATVRRQIDELKRMLASGDLKQIDQNRLRIASEDLVVMFQTAAPEIALARPTLELQ
ncbi:EfeM/EfeO family lipoprotein [Bradyrhizobium sp. STM 3557]|uniref:EfeM/EfeO family lipoprotein n=1 Tax=Bradyrhizobium sp. STM 3557 TaxID=578920 RepID=UPI00388F9918